MRQVDFYDKTYGNFSEEILAAVRRETFGEDIGQNSWLTAEELRIFLPWLGLKRRQRLLEVASGSGGPALFLARTLDCRVTGIDINEQGIAAAKRQAQEAGLKNRVEFRFVDANQPLPFEPASFQAIICIDAINHFHDRLRVLQAWRQALKPGGRILYTDPVVVTGPVSSEEISVRSAIGFFLFMPPGENEQLLEQAGFQLIHMADATENAVRVSGRWYQARCRRQADLVRLEGQERFDQLQYFLSMVYRLSSERRLSRIVYVAEKQEV
jgi:SAM-dependent methyltransferase